MTRLRRTPRRPADKLPFDGLIFHVLSSRSGNLGWGSNVDSITPTPTRLE